MPKSKSAKKNDGSVKFLEPIPRPELVFGLIGPIGADVKPITEAIKDSLSSANYEVAEISVSEQIGKLYNLDLHNISEDQRISRLMDAGNALRENSGLAEAAAVLAIFRMWEIRREREAAGQATKKGVAFVLRSLKNPEEIEKLRLLYGKGFIAISIYTPRDDRISALSEKISKSYLGVAPSKFSPAALARNLVDRDENEDSSYGQNVRDSFPLADFFVDVSSPEKVGGQLKRFLDLTFGYRFHTPTKNEHGMFQAASAALRSADLNRQVGAAIARPTGEIISIGCNDVPKATGDQYWEGEKNDARDFLLGRDSSAEQREQMLTELLGKLLEGRLLAKEYNKETIIDLSKSLLYGTGKSILRGAGLMNLLEFGRSVHAEMAALMTAARNGLAVQGATLYCTTFPCHMCARHIVAAGIARVVYIEPYPKSRAKQLHKDSILVDEQGESEDYVRFLPFQGIAPRQYQTIFSANDLRKNAEGEAIKWSMSDGKLRWQRFNNTYQAIEIELIERILPKLQNAAKIKMANPVSPQESNDGRANIRTKSAAGKTTNSAGSKRSSAKVAGPRRNR